MSRANDGGWDFVKEGDIIQYNEDGYVAMVQVLLDTSDAEKYEFVVKIIASDGAFRAGAIFTVMSRKNDLFVYSGMPQFYKSIEYAPLPLGSPWKSSLPGREYCGIDFIRRAGYRDDQR